ncbi:MAG: histidine kinase [Deltaproteobacteria bacterium]|nr:histidine kinase [Deltaproteobacteria bacterium]
MPVSGEAFTMPGPLERADAKELELQIRTVMVNEVASSLIQAMPDYVMLLNRYRQIVAVNQNILHMAGAAGPEELLGKCPGEVFNCVHAADTAGGCGASRHCSVCGGMLATLESRKTGAQSVRDSHFTTGGADQAAIDLLTMATPITIGGTEYTLLVLRDVSSEKRRDVLERVFFHDVVNTAGGIYGLASMLAEQEDVPEHVQTEYKQWLVTLSENLLDEIRNQRKLLAAEQGEFVPELVCVSIRSVLREILTLYGHHEKTPGRVLKLLEGGDWEVVSDASVLRRIIGNMTINALEATPPGGTVTLSALSDGREVTVEVHNSGVIAPYIQLQLFNRSFSTKAAAGRGIGTYSMKLFGERYLKGRVSFRSSREEGTVFTFSLPLTRQ